MTTDLARRWALLERAGFNVLNLAAPDIAIDLLTDAWHSSPDADTARDDHAPEPALAALAQELYGPARYVATTKGRAAEDAVAAAIAVPGGAVVTNHLFATTQGAFRRHGMAVEVGKLAGPGAADLDIAWLAQRMREGRVEVVALEACNNALAGWPLHDESVAAVRTLCREHGARLFIDASRIFANFSDGDRGRVRALLAHADVFTASCSKELLVPQGGVAAVRDADTERKVWTYAFERGTALDPLAARAALARGMRRVRDDASVFVARKTRLVQLAAELRARGIPVIHPAGQHAVFVDVGALVGKDDPLRARWLEATLFHVGAVRAMVHRSDHFATWTLRLPLRVAPVAPDDPAGIARAVAALFATADSGRRLVPAPGDAPHPLLARYRLTGGAPPPKAASGSENMEELT